jgi:hypothetical protein
MGHGSELYLDLDLDRMGLLNEWRGFELAPNPMMRRSMPEPLSEDLMVRSQKESCKVRQLFADV